MKTLFLNFIMAMAIFAVAPVASAATQAVVGQPAPDFTATNSKGETVKLSDYRGKNVVLEWTNHECPFVVKHYDSGNMQKLQKEATADDVVWLTILSSAPKKQGHVSGEEADKIAAEQGAQSTARILDPSGEIGQMYGAKTTPHMYVIDTDGTLAYAGAIDSDPSFRTEGIADATNYVMAALNDLEQGQAVQVASTKPYGCAVKY